MSKHARANLGDDTDEAINFGSGSSSKAEVLEEWSFTAMRHPKVDS